jgi:Cys-tRNA(Pro) deacylase
MHGDRSVSLKALARALNLKSVAPCSPKAAQKYTGYQVGGISPFGTSRAVSVYLEASILDLPKIWINAGKRGLLIELSPRDAAEVLKASIVNTAI